MPTNEAQLLGPAVEVTGLECGYDDKVILKDVSFTVARGEIFFVIGGSGCGKSTLLRPRDIHCRQLTLRKNL